ncbi:hypothetical protein V5F79_22165 [Xanthobacter flavus]|uniref:STY1053 family phage-associated protein n=1 Tax=Xanthobacter flavus TaxID=281 RepID=UPI0037267F30
MALINVVKPFLLNLGYALKRFEAGIIEVEEEIASHWYTLLHAERLPDPEPVEPVAEQPAEPVAEPAPAQPEPAVDPVAEPAPAETPAEPAPVEPAAAETESVTIEPDGSTHVDTPDEVSEKVSLKAEAEALGIPVDGRWGVTRLQAEIAAKKSAG